MYNDQHTLAIQRLHVLFTAARFVIETNTLEYMTTTTLYEYELWKVLYIRCRQCKLLKI